MADTSTQDGHQRFLGIHTYKKTPYTTKSISDMVIFYKALRQAFFCTYLYNIKQKITKEVTRQRLEVVRVREFEISPPIYKHSILPYPDISFYKI